MLAAIYGFPFLSRPGSVTIVLLTLNSRNMLPKLSPGTFSAFAIFLYPFPVRVLLSGLQYILVW